jgi:UDP-N-acetylglucosamine/UDP-N-acetyl-alpha-D-glucosaminouronate 4-epimerase
VSWLVTGGAGFIGSHIVETLTSRGEQVRVVDNLLTGKLENIAPFMNRIEFVEADLADPDVAARCVDGVDYVLHQAALPSVPRSVADPLASHHNCVTATVALLEAARKAGVKRVVQASSSSVYGDQPQLPKVETQTPDPRSPYAAAKLACEAYAAAFNRLYGLSTVSLRYFNIFGPRQDPKSQYAAVVPAFATAVMSGERPTVYGDGGQSRDFTYVANAVEANIRAATADTPLAGEAVNVACGQSVTLLELLADIERITGKKAEPLFEELRAGDVRESLADISRAKELFGYEPRVSFAEGLELTVSSFQQKEKDA